MKSVEPDGPGRAAPLGATVDGDGVNFAVFSEHAERIAVCLFDEDGQVETRRVMLAERDGPIWHGHVAGLRPGQLYGLRAWGPYAPAKGHRFNPNKLLIDPYARRITGHPVWHDALMGYTVGSPHGDLSFDPRDSAPHMPRCVVEPPPDPAAPGGRLATPPEDTVIYEAHVRGLTRAHPEAAPQGSFAALASDPMLDHLTKLGVTAVELMPVQAFLNDRSLVDRGLTNFWGYQTIGFLAPEPRYLSRPRIAEFRHMVDRLHMAGIEVILDVVYNHTGEGDETGPTLAFRGLDNASYYRLSPDGRGYVNDTGTGNTLNLAHPMVMRMVLDSLRYWAGAMGVDGFRFDLGVTLGRGARGFDPDAPLFQAIRQDPLLARLKLIAEPWDLGPGGYRLGGFPPPFMEWNDRFRDGVRRFWRGDAGMVPLLADAVTGSAGQFDRAGRLPVASVNFVAAHDGFTLADVVSYARKHNRANGWGNRDGHDANFSDNMGAEGPTADPAIAAARARRRRNLLATVMLSQGTPMLLAGDEIGHSQRGNNNAYCQDNEIAWRDWARADAGFLAFTRALIGFRKAHPMLRQRRFLHARERRFDRIEDLVWRRADGAEMSRGDWDDPDLRLLGAEIRTASGTPAYAAREEALFLVFNGGAAATVALPGAPSGWRWMRALDTAAPSFDPVPAHGPAWDCPADSVTVFALHWAGQVDPPGAG
jgi:isoamylase